MPTAQQVTLSQVIDAIFDSFKDYWVANANTPISWPDVKFDVEDEADDTGWIKVSLTHIPGLETRINVETPPVYRRQAIFSVQVFTKPGSGVKSNYNLCQDVLNWLEVSAQTVFYWFRNPNLNEVGVDPNSGFFQVNVTATVIYDVIR
jgi:hypothetical protein